MKPGPKLAAQFILENLGLDSAPQNVLEILTEIVLERRWASERSDAREKAESWRMATLEYLRIEVGSLNKVGRPPRIAFNSSSDYIIQGACFVEPKDDAGTRESKQRRLRSGEYFGAIRKLTPASFEALCGKLIELLGVKGARVTRRTADEGIDFYGKLSLDSILFPHDLSPTIQKQLSIWLIGQAKRYVAGQSGTPEIRDLVGAIALGRAGAFGSRGDPFPDLEIRVADPVFAIFMTTGTLSSAAWRLLERSGVIGMDGEMIAAFLADRGAGLLGASFSEDEFLRWVASSPS